MLIRVEAGESINIFPDTFVICVKKMATVLMNFDVRIRVKVGVGISADRITLF